MDIIDIIHEEQELDLLLTEEEFTDMEQSVIRQFQDEAEQAYIRLPQPEAAQVAQVVMLAEIALQLAKLNEHLSNLAHPPMQYANEDEAMQAYLGEQARRKAEDEAGTHPPNCDCYYCSAE